MSLSDVDKGPVTAPIMACVPHSSSPSCLREVALEAGIGSVPPIGQFVGGLPAISIVVPVDADRSQSSEETLLCLGAEGLCVLLEQLKHHFGSQSGTGYEDCRFGGHRSFAEPLRNPLQPSEQAGHDLLVRGCSMQCQSHHAVHHHRCGEQV